MPTNIEIKAGVRDAALLRKRAEGLSDTPGELLIQEDTFFAVPVGRLKLRRLAPSRGELIYYEREDLSGPKSSHYLVCRTSDPEGLHAVIASFLAVRGVVRKRRWLFKTGNTRIHVDEVEGLGAFLELEVVLQPGQSAEDGKAVAEDLMRKLSIHKADLVEGAYVDLLGNPDTTPSDGSAQ